jgi:nucleotide sugar dehydrogenase
VATTSYADAIPDSDVVVIVVPLFVDAADQPDFGWMDSATSSVAEHLTRDTLVLYETTLPVGTTRTRWKPQLEKGSGLTEGQDFHVAFSPERVLTGRVFEDLRKYPKLVGGLSPEGASQARDFYIASLQFDDRPDLPRANGVWDLGSAEAAEMAKLAETTYRDVNIGLANEFAVYAERAGIDVYQVIEAANSQPYSHIHRPGISVGGHCIPVYPRLYLFNDPDARVVQAGRLANAAMPKHAVNLLAAELGDLTGTRVVVLGAAYRGGAKESAFSGVFPIVEELHGRGAAVTVHDPLFNDDELQGLGLVPHALGDVVDAAIVHTDHAVYAELTSADLPGVTVAIDGRGSLNANKLYGVRIITIGKAQSA